MNDITMRLKADQSIMEALKEDISSEDVTTNSVMKEAADGEVELICKQDGIAAGLEVFGRVFKLLDEKVEITFFCKDGDEVKKGEKMGILRGDIRVLLSGERVSPEDYQKKAEENMMNLVKEAQENRKKIILSALVALRSQRVFRALEEG